MLSLLFASVQLGRSCGSAATIRPLGIATMSPAIDLVSFVSSPRSSIGADAQVDVIVGRGLHNSLDPAATDEDAQIIQKIGAPLSGHSNERIQRRIRG
jgi:hypothetical protein